MSKDEYVYGHVLEALSGGLYPNKLDVIREYLQNSYDSIREYIRAAENDEEKEKRKAESKVVITAKGGSLFIYDNATGMDFQTLNEYRKIGFSRKPFGEYAGWRGIGKAAGFAVAEKLIVTTCQGKGETYQLTFDAKNMIQEVWELRSQGKNIPFNELIEKHSRIKTIEGGDKPSTIVELHKVKQEAPELLNEDLLIAHLSMIAPVPFRSDFKYSNAIEKQLGSAIEDYTPINLYVEDKKVYKPYLEKWAETEEEGPT
ncbi:ATP-binding protein, partial [Candidatus Bathyarchaeota archaeon]|nr:ATP-binding protein [Candidatus Bathyarchaeota archaeon]